MRHGWLVSGMLIACAGKAPPSTNNPDAPGASDGGTDGGSSTSAAVSGKTLDYNAFYLGTSDALSATSISTDGIAPVVNDASGSDASYSIDVPVGSSLYFMTSRANYRTTRNVPVTVAAMPVMQDQLVVSEDYITSQYNLLTPPKTPVGGTGYLAALLEKPDGTALTGVTLASVVLQTTATPPTTVTVTGPYFVGSNNEIDQNLTVSTAETVGTMTTAQVAMMDIPPGTYTLSVTYTNGMGQSVTNTTTVIIAADAATLAVSKGQNALTITTPSFATDIYPKLQSAGNGGLGCANCHTAGGPGEVLKYDDPEATVYANIMAANVVNTTTPASSLILVNPLYPPSNGHPNASFLDVTDPNYELFLAWITQGAKP
ncbi:MAG TPA: hypothetical protein VMJ10_16335 [Kofleriaceae bacterium]|nr:hypothetical protein [Kofleriaceae bacterium]